MFIYIVQNHTVACIREKPQQSNKSYEAHATLTFQSNQNRRESHGFPKIFIQKTYTTQAIGYKMLMLPSYMQSVEAKV